MPVLFRRWRRLAVIVLLLLVATAVTLILTRQSPLDAARERYDRIRVGMTEDEVGEILKGWVPFGPSAMPGGGVGRLAEWRDERSGVFAHLAFGPDGKVIHKDLEEGDQSFNGHLKRLGEKVLQRFR